MSEGMPVSGDGTYEALNLDQAEAEQDPFTLERYRQALRFFPPQTRDVLDVGCATGRGGALITAAHPGIRLVGLDCVRQRIEHLPAVYAEGLYGMLPDIPAPARSFDVIVAGELIEHLKPADVTPTLEEFARVLRPGGRLILTTPNPSDVKRRLRGESILGGAHLSEHDARGLTRRLSALGFWKIRIVGSGKTTRFLGTRFPLPLYGSYMAVAELR